MSSDATPERYAELRARISRLPTEPGVYLFEDEAGRVLYVGKATNLRARVRSYLGRTDSRPLIGLMMRRVADVRVITTETAEAALLLENTLIKREKPAYNLRLKDDKSYLLVRVDRSHPFPRLRLVRKVKKDGAQYVGPFASAKALRRSVRYLRTLYPLRSCSDRELEERESPCLYHQIGRCAAPCVDAISPERYAEHVDGTLAVLRGRDDGLLDRLRREMGEASDALAFERAALLRDRADAIERALARQEAVFPDGRERDVLAIAAAGGVAMLGIVYVRDGVVVATRALPQRTQLPSAELLHAFLGRFYLNGKVVPPDILVPTEPDDREGLEAMLARLRDGRVRIRVPKRGPDAELVALARRNAEQALAEHGVRAKQMQAALTSLAGHLGMDAAPTRIEGYDLSHLGGRDPVAAMSVLVGGMTDTSAYRNFAIQDAAGGDDYAGMAEVIRRRFAAGTKLGDWPDLILIDGGRGQVEAARSAAGQADVRIVGLAKARAAKGTEERIILLDREEPLILEPDDPALRLLVRARDEAHRFAGRYQKKKRARSLESQALADVPGIGPSRQRRLLRQFGSLEGIRDAAFEDLAAVPGIGERLARLIRDRLDIGDRGPLAD